MMASEEKAEALQIWEAEWTAFLRHIVAHYSQSVAKY